MKKIETHSVGIDRGEVVLFSDFEHDGVMWTGQGPRQNRAFVQFKEPFVSAPFVQIWLTMWDASNTTNTRMDVAAEDVTSTGFAAVFRTWGDSKVARVRIAWLAIGEAQNEEIWEVD